MKNIMKNKRTLSAFVSIDSWSYIINEKGNGYCTTLEGYGSCTPVQVLQDWLDKLPKKAWNRVYKNCEKAGKAIKPKPVYKGKKIKSVDELTKLYFKKYGKCTTMTRSPLPYYPRWINTIYAFLHSYFWLPCPECGKNFGGHEGIGSIGDSMGGGWMICPECSLKEYNKHGDFYK